MAQEQNLDEIQWRSPRDVQEMGGIHTNTVLPYFSKSPFFDAMSNNATITTQAMYNPNLFHLIQTRQAFEARLRTMQGLEFMVTADPLDNGTKAIENNVWVISKQNRRKVAGADDQVTPISSYFVVGENIYMAPVLGEILGNRLLSTVTTLTGLIEKASGMLEFTPSRGHHYRPPSKKRSLSSAITQPGRSSREGTPASSIQETQSVSRSATVAKPTSTLSQEAQLLEDSYRLTMRYGNEYMDETPLVGEPGAFKLNKIREAPRSIAATTERNASPILEPEVPPIETTTTVEIPPRKHSKGGDKSPTSATVKEKKMRRKSKVAGSTTTVSTPK